MILYTLHYVRLHNITLHTHKHYMYTNFSDSQQLPRQDAKQSPLPKSVCEVQTGGIFWPAMRALWCNTFFFVYNLIFVWICNLPRCDTKWYLLCFLTWFTQLKCPKCPKLVAGLCGLAVSPCCCFWQIGWRTRAGQPGATISVCPNYWSLKIMVEYHYSLTKQLMFRESSITGWSSITNNNRTYGYDIGIPRRSSILLKNSRNVSC